MTGSQALALLAWGLSPGYWAAWGAVATTLVALCVCRAAGPTEGRGGATGQCGEQGKHLRLGMQRKAQSPGLPLLCARCQVCMFICEDSLVLTLLIKLT